MHPTEMRLFSDLRSFTVLIKIASCKFYHNYVGKWSASIFLVWHIKICSSDYVLVFRNDAVKLNSKIDVEKDYKWSKNRIFSVMCVMQRRLSPRHEKILALINTTTSCKFYYYCVCSWNASTFLVVYALPCKDCTYIIEKGRSMEIHLVANICASKNEKLNYKLTRIDLKRIIFHYLYQLWNYNVIPIKNCFMFSLNIGLFRYDR